MVEMVHIVMTGLVSTFDLTRLVMWLFYTLSHVSYIQPLLYCRKLTEVTFLCEYRIIVKGWTERCARCGRELGADPSELPETSVQSMRRGSACHLSTVQRTSPVATTVP